MSTAAVTVAGSRPSTLPPPAPHPDAVGPDPAVVIAVPPTSSTIRYHVLGPLEVLAPDGTPIDITSPKLRALVSVLLMSPGRPVSVDRIVSSLWGDEPPGAATSTLQAYISQLRRLLEPDRGPREPARRLVTRTPGYALVPDPGALDSDELARLLADGDAAVAEGRPDRAESVFASALTLRRGTPFADVAEEPFALGAVARLEQLLLHAAERRIDAMLAQGKVAAAAAELEPLVAEHPMRERFWAQLIEAFYRADRQADALRAYRSCRRHLTEELGVEPSPAVRELERMILEQRPMVTAPPTASPPVAVATPELEAFDDPDPAAGVVGRAAELARVTELLARAADGRGGSVITIEGESGIGKSRLAEEIMRRAATAGFATAWSTCIDDVGMPVLWPWEQALVSLGIPAPEPVADADADVARFRRIVAMLDALVLAAATTPLMVVIDDVQWADAATLQALTVAAARAPGGRLIVVVTVRRPDERGESAVAPVLADLTRSRSAHRFRLAGLAADDVTRLVAELAGGHVDPEMAATVADRSGGNPFFVTELVRLLVSESTLSTAPSTATLDSVPDSVREVVGRRLARLPEDTAAVLRLAAVAGSIIDLDLLGRATGTGPDEVASVLEVAVATGMLIELDDGMGWRFSHSLVQDAIAATLGRAQRARLHRSLATAIEALHGDDLEWHLDDLARHHVAAALVGPTDDAVRWCCVAADTARARGRFDWAAKLGQDALHLARRTVGIDDTVVFDLLLDLARDQRASGDVDAFGHTLNEAIDLSRRLRDPHRTALAASELGWVNLWNLRPYGSIDDAACVEIERLADAEQEPALAARLYGAVAVELYYGPRREHGEMLARKAVALARDVGDPMLRGRTLNNFALAAWTPDSEADRNASLDEALSLAGRLPRFTEAIARLHRATVRLRSGDVRGATDDLRRCQALNSEPASPELAAQSTYAESGLAMLHGEWDDAARLADDAFERHSRLGIWGAEWCWIVQQTAIREARGGLGEVLDELVERATPPEVAPARCTVVLAAVAAGDLERARQLRDRWRWQDDPRDWGWLHRVADWTEVLARLGDPADHGELREMVERLAPFADEQRVAGTIVAARGSMRHVLALAARTLGDIPTAIRERDAAVAANRAIGAAWWAERVAADLPLDRAD